MIRQVHLLVCFIMYSVLVNANISGRNILTNKADHDNLSKKTKFNVILANFIVRGIIVVVHHSNKVVVECIH